VTDGTMLAPPATLSWLLAAALVVTARGMCKRVRGALGSLARRFGVSPVPPPPPYPTPPHEPSALPPRSLRVLYLGRALFVVAARAACLLIVCGSAGRLHTCATGSLMQLGVHDVLLPTRMCMCVCVFPPPLPPPTGSRLLLP
jgi:hypothetical protein